MHDVDTRFELAAQAQKQRNGLVRGFARPEEASHVAISEANFPLPRIGQCCVDGSRQFRMSEQRCGERRQFRQSHAQIGLRDMRKFSVRRWGPEST